MTTQGSASLYDAPNTTALFYKLLAKSLREFSIREQMRRFGRRTKRRIFGKFEAFKELFELLTRHYGPKNTHGTAALRAFRDIDIEDSFEEVSPLDVSRFFFVWLSHSYRISEDFRYTANKKPRSDDQYAPSGKGG